MYAYTDSSTMPAKVDNLASKPAKVDNLASKPAKVKYFNLEAGVKICQGFIYIIFKLEFYKIRKYGR